MKEVRILLKIDKILQTFVKILLKFDKQLIKILSNYVFLHAGSDSRDRGRGRAPAGPRPGRAGPRHGQKNIKKCVSFFVKRSKKEKVVKKVSFCHAVRAVPDTPVPCRAEKLRAGLAVPCRGHPVNKKNMKSKSATVLLFVFFRFSIDLA